MLVSNENLGPGVEALPALTSSSALLLDLDGAFSESGIRRRRRTQYRRALSWMVMTRAVSALRRLADLVLAAFLIILLSPFVLVLLAIAHLRGGGIRKQAKLGRWAIPFNRYEFAFSARKGSWSSPLITSLPALFNILHGDMSFIGPRAISPHGPLPHEPTAWKRYDLRPGLLSLWWLRKRANMAYTSEVGLDVEYVETSSLWGDLGIAMRAIPTVFFGGSVSNPTAEVKFLGVRIDNLTMAEASGRIVELTDIDEPVQVCFVNAACFNIAAHDRKYLSTLNQADLILADGIGVRIAGNIFNQKIRENINGTDMLPYLCEALEKSGKSMYLLGGRPGVPEDAAGWIRDRYPFLRLAGLHHGYFKAEEEPRILRQISESRADVLLVALGAPKQDTWIADHKDELGTTVAVGVGGLLDFYSGRVQRAPAWIRELGMEWLYRFLQEPRRMWRRYFVGNAVFLCRVLRVRVAARMFPRRSDGFLS